MATLRFLADIDISSNKIQNLADGTAAGDAVNKGQLDGKLGTTLNSAQVFVGNASNVATAVTLSGDVSLSNAGVVTIANDAVTYAKMQNVSATSRLLGRVSTGSGDVEELTGTQATALLDNFTSTLKGLVPGSGGGTSNFLRADGTWAAPSGSITGTGTTNYLVKYTGTNSIGISQIFDNGTNVGVGTASPSQRLHVTGNILTSGTNTQYLGQTTNDATNPVYSFTGDENTGLHKPATADNLSLVTGGAERVRIDANGNVSIGTTSTNNRLSVALDNTSHISLAGTVASFGNSASGNSAYLSIHGAFNANSGIIFTDASIAYKGRLIYNNSTEHFEFHTDGTEKMRITSAGNVGIGTTMPSERLHVSGNLLIDGANQNRYIQTEGTQTATGRLIVQAGAQGANYGGAVNLFAHAHATKPGWVTVGLSSGAGGKFTVNSQALGGGTDVFVVQDNGNVGIGETSPAVKFVSNGQSQINGVLSLKGNGNTAFSTGTASELRLWNDNSSKTFSLHHTNNSQFRILDPSTNLCWQITDGGKFVVNVADNDSTAFSASILGGGSTFLQMDSTNDNERLILGSVTTGAVVKLHGGRHVDITTLTANFTLRKSDYVVEANATAGAFTITLPATPVTGQVYYIVRITSGANNVTIDGNGKNINGAATLVLSNQYDTAQILYNSTEWLKI